MTHTKNMTLARLRSMATRSFKIDYFDKALASHSPDPTDPSVTERVITIMLAEAFARAGAIDAPPVSAGSSPTNSK